MKQKIENRIVPYSNQALQLFLLGRTVITSLAEEKLNRADIEEALQRHACGDWGELDAEDRFENDRALFFGERILSAFYSSDDVKFWIITEADRSVTTILLPGDY